MLINKNVPKLTVGQRCVNTALVKYFAVLSGVLGCYVNLEAKHLECRKGVPNIEFP